MRTGKRNRWRDLLELLNLKQSGELKKDLLFEYSYPLKYLLKKNNMTEQNLAIKLNVHPLTVYRWAKSTRVIDHTKSIDKRLRPPDEIHKKLYKELLNDV